MASVNRRPGTDKKGKPYGWEVRWRDAGGRNRSRTFARKKDADEYALTAAMEVRTGTNLPSADRLTVASVATEFQRHMDDRQRDGSIGEAHRAKTALLLRVHVLPYLGNVKLADLSLARLEIWYREMRAARKLAVRTARYAVQSLKMVLDFAMDREWVARNMAVRLLASLRGQKTAAVRTFTVDEARALLLTTGLPTYQGRHPEANLRMQCFVHLGALCGLRVGEIVGLAVDAINLDCGVLRVAQSHSRLDGLKAPKTAAGVREVGLPRHVAALLAAWLREHYRENERRLLFLNGQGRPISQDQFRRGSWGPLLARAGLGDDPLKPVFHFHALRHFAASWMIDADWNLLEVAKTLGHKKVDMTLSTYAHALKNRGASRDAMQALSDRLLPAPPLALTSSRTQGVRIAA